jgi:ATP-binding protein involved in chromosome partitioning
MFRKVEVPVLGIVENMAQYCCPNCGHTEPVFGAGGGEKLAREHGSTLLGSLPLSAKIRAQADGGRPTVIAEPDSPEAQSYRAIARRAAARLAHGSVQASFPSIEIE